MAAQRNIPAQSPRLWKLKLNGTAVTDTGVASLAGIGSLRHLHIEETPVTDAGLAALLGAPALDSLHVRGTKVSRQGLSAFRAARPRVKVVVE